MTLKQRDGDLLQLTIEGEFDIIVHGCNCFNTMKSGIAGQIANQFPEVVKSDHQTIKGDRSKIGTFNIVKFNRNDLDHFYIVNAYTQYTYARDHDVFEYDGFELILDNLSKVDIFKNNRFGFPLIGCGLAGGDEERIIKMLDKFAENNNVTLVRYSK